MTDMQSEIVYQNSKDKEFKDLSDREKYHRTQHHIDEQQRQADEATDPGERAALGRKIESLRTARDQWKGSKDSD